MKLPLYHNFSEFEKNYTKDLKVWFKDEPQTEERDFLRNLFTFKYKIYSHKDIEFLVLERKHGALVEVSYSYPNIHAIFKAQFTEYLGMLSKAKKFHNKRLGREFNWDEFIERQVFGKYKLFLDKMSNDDFQVLKTTFFTGVHSVNQDLHFTGISRILFEKYCFLDGSLIKMDWETFFEKEYNEKYKIAEWITQRLNLEDNTNENPESDYSENEDKEKLIILEKLKIIDYIRSIQTKPEIISHTAEILSSFTGIASGTLYSYLRPMLSANRDNNDKNSPYKNPENIFNANKTLHKLKTNVDNND